MKIESLKGEGLYYHRPYGIAMRKMGPFVFVQGIIATDPKTGKLIKDLDVLTDFDRPSGECWFLSRKYSADARLH